MIKIHFLIRILCLFFLINVIGGCVPIILGGGAVSSKMSLQEKTVGESLSDSTIWTKIRAAFIKNEIDSLFGSVNVEVNEGKVLLTGSVEKKEDIITILRLVWQQDGVKDVINELKIVPKVERPGVFEYTRDSWITTQIKTKLFLSGKVRSINYSIETIDGTVYLFGISRNEEEIEDVRDIISTVKGVRNIKVYVRVKKDIDARIEDTNSNSSSLQENDKMDDELDLDHEVESEFSNKSKKDRQVKIEEDEIFDEDN